MRLISLVAAVVTFVAVLSGGSASAAPCDAALSPSVNPSAVGQEVEIDVGCLRLNPNIEYHVSIQNLSTGEMSLHEAVTGDVSFTFTDAGEYGVQLHSQRSGKSVTIEDFYVQVVE